VGNFTCLRNKLSILTASAKICTSLVGESEERNTFPYANSRVNEPTTTFNTNLVGRVLREIGERQIYTLRLHHKNTNTKFSILSGAAALHSARRRTLKIISL
jgi:hypothetical protein